MAAIGLLLESQTWHVHGSLEKISVFSLIIKAQAGSLTAGTQPLGGNDDFNLRKHAKCGLLEARSIFPLHYF